MGGPTLGERDRVGQRCPLADHPTRCLDVGSGVQEGVEHSHVIAARGPVQRGLRVRPGETALTSAPASSSSVTTSEPFGKWPG